MNNLEKWIPTAYGALITEISADTIKADISAKLKQEYLAPLKEHEE